MSTDKKPLISMVAAIGTRTRALGKDNKLLWHIPEDLKHFRRLTEGHPIIMGRTTFESIGRPLPNRTNIIITRDTNYHPEGCVVCHSPEEALERAKEIEQNEIFIIGGGQIFELLLPITDKLYLTLVDDDTPGDTYFPDYQNDFPQISHREERAQDGLRYSFVELARPPNLNAENELFEDMTKKQFKWWSLFYDSGLIRLFYFRRIYRKIIATIKHEAEVKLKPKAKFLDVACGTGEIICRLAQEFPHVQFVGVDFSKEMLNKTIKKTKGLANVKIIQANIRNLPFPDASFDIILCSDSLHHFASPEEPFREINRVAKQGSFFLLVDPAYDTMIQKIIVGLFGKILETAKKYYSKEEINNLSEDTSFVINSSFAYHFTNFFICKN